MTDLTFDRSVWLFQWLDKIGLCRRRNII